MPAWGRNISGIKCKAKRVAVFAKVKKEKKEAKKERRNKRDQVEAELGDAAPPRQVSALL